MGIISKKNNCRCFLYFIINCIMMNEINIPFARPLLEVEERKAAAAVLDGNILTHGPQCKLFEKNFSEFNLSSHAVSVSNCTSAMFLSLKALGIGPGDEVIVPAMTHIATAHCVSHTGAKVVFVDIDSNTGNINPNLILSKINKNTKAIIVVHFIGLPADMDSILKIIYGHNLFLIEDCAAALGARYGQKLVGTFGNTGCFSFYPTKHITTMEGGMLITNDNKLSNLIRKSSSFGYTKNLYERSIPGVYDVDLLGYNFRMNEVSAAIGIEQLKKINSFISKRNSNAAILRDKLSGNANIYVLPGKDGKSASSNFCVNIVLNFGGENTRNNLILELQKNNIGTSVHYPVCLPKSIYYKGLGNKETYSVAEHYAAHTISLPCGPHLGSDQANLIADIFIKCLEGTL